MIIHPSIPSHRPAAQVLHEALVRDAGATIYAGLVRER
jgi:hypothetical protein